MLCVICYMSEYGDVLALIQIYFLGLSLYDKVCFPVSNYMNNPSFHSSYYFKSPLHLHKMQNTKNYAH